MGKLIRGVFDPELKFEFVEGAPEVDGEHVLAKVRGQFFVPGGTSRNGRYYPPEVWERQLGLENIKTKLENRQMFGTIGHDDVINDRNLREGMMSHIVTRLNPDGKGCEALIINTPAGRVLNTVLHAGAKLYASSRADGEYKGTYNGVPSVDPEQFKLEGIDFVIDPGFLEANPSLVENYREDFNSTLSLGDGAPKGQSRYKKEVETMGSDIGKEMVEAYLTENLRLKEELNHALGDLQTQITKANALETEKGIWAKADRDLAEARAELAKAQATIKEYEPLGSPQDIGRAFDLAMKMKESLKRLGSPKEIEHVFDVATERLREYKDLGTVREIGKALSLARKLLEAYKPLGKPSEIRVAFNRAEAFVKKVRETRERKRAEDLSKELGIPEEEVKKALGKSLKEEDIKALAKSIRESAKTEDRYKVVSQKKVDAGGSDDDSERKVDFEESNLERLGRHFGKTVPASRSKPAKAFSHRINE